jgi:hypothetical protein
VLHEFSYNWTQTDSLGTAGNLASFLYAGLRIGESVVPYLLIDGLRVASNDLHTYPMSAAKQAIGVRWEFTPLLALKVQLERARLDQGHGMHSMHSGAHSMPYSHALRLQLAYGVQ